jgi:hypothetical protein
MQQDNCLVNHCGLCVRPLWQDSYIDMPGFYYTTACCGWRFCHQCYLGALGWNAIPHSCPVCLTIRVWHRESARFPQGRTNRARTLLEPHTPDAERHGAERCADDTCMCRERAMIITPMRRQRWLTGLDLGFPAPRPLTTLAPQGLTRQQ